MEIYIVFLELKLLRWQCGVDFIMIFSWQVSSKSNMIESSNWDYGLEALLLNTFREKLNTHLMLQQTMEYDNEYIGFCSWLVGKSCSEFKYDFLGIHEYVFGSSFLLTLDM